MEAREAKNLAELAGQSSLAELYSLVHELHLRRREEGLKVADLGYQEELKALIHLVHRLGRLEEHRDPDPQLLAKLKQASAPWRRVKPRGLLQSAWAALDLSWADLAAAFALLLAQEGLAKLLGTRLPQLKDYLNLQRLLSLFFASRLARAGRQQVEGRYAAGHQELKELLPRELDLSKLPEQIPLLPLPKERLLISPELLYDHLLQKYLEVALFYHACSTDGERVAENLPGWNLTSAGAPNLLGKGGKASAGFSGAVQGGLLKEKEAGTGGVLPSKENRR